MLDLEKVEFDRIASGLRVAAACSYRASTPAGMARQAHAVDRALSEGVDAAGLMRLIERHRIQGLAWDTLARLDRLELLGACRSRLQEAAREVRVRALQLAMAEQRLLRDFAREGVECLPLKGGPGLSRKLYGDLGLRQCKDLDLIVRPEQLQRAVRFLESWGWIAKTPVWMSSRPHRWLCARLLKDLSFVHPKGDILLELHFRFERGWEPRRESDWWDGFQSLDERSLRHAEFLFLCLHGAEHCWHRLKWLGDLAAHLERNPNVWEDCAPLARKLGLDAVVVQVKDLLGLLYMDDDAEMAGCQDQVPVAFSLHSMTQMERADMEAWEEKAAALAEDAFRRGFLRSRSVQGRTVLQRLVELVVRIGDVESLGPGARGVFVSVVARIPSWIWRYGGLLLGKTARRSFRFCRIAECGAALVVGAFARRCLPFSWISKYLGKQAEIGMPSAIDEKTRKELMGVFEDWHRRWPWPPSCLTEVIALRILLDRRGLSGTACFGVRSESSGALDAHAWMECGGHVLPRRQDVSAFRLVSTFWR